MHTFQLHVYNTSHAKPVYKINADSSVRIEHCYIKISILNNSIFSKHL